VTECGDAGQNAANTPAIRCNTCVAHTLAPELLDRRAFDFSSDEEGKYIMRHGLLAALALTAAVASCAKKNESEPRYSPASRGAQSNDRSISAITNERCDRELRCGNIGADKRYGSRDECVRKLNDSGYDSLGPTECRTGIDQGELSQCLQSIRSEDCNSPLDTLERIAACRSGELCKD
jgi:hypothetical protein